MNKTVLITLCGFIFLTGCGNRTKQTLIQKTPSLIQQEQVKPKSETPNKSKTLIYTITKYELFQNGDTWKFVLIDENIPYAELKEIANELHNKYPSTCFKIFSNIKTLKLVYEYDATNSYVTKQIAYPETAYNKDNRGLINKMWNSDSQESRWSYTSQDYETIELK